MEIIRRVDNISSLATWSGSMESNWKNGKCSLTRPLTVTRTDQLDISCLLIGIHQRTITDQTIMKKCIITLQLFLENKFRHWSNYVVVSSRAFASQKNHAQNLSDNCFGFHSFESRKYLHQAFLSIHLSWIPVKRVGKVPDQVLSKLH